MTHASLFSGIGGPEVAAAMLGWDNLFHCEINDFCRKILQYWFPQITGYFVQRLEEGWLRDKWVDIKGFDRYKDAKELLEILEQ